MSQVRIIPLDTAQHVDPKTIGPKAMSLIRLGRLGFNVPAGFCITAAAFQEHLEQNNLPARLKTAVDELAKAPARPGPGKSSFPHSGRQSPKLLRPRRPVKK